MDQDRKFTMNKIPKIQQYEFQGKVYNIGYRVTTEAMKSLGLRNNPNIIQYKMNKWIHPFNKKVIEGISDFGGIWLARTPGIAKEYQKYMKSEHNKKTRVFKSLIGKVLFANSGRIKTDKVYLFEEIFLD